MPALHKLAPTILLLLPACTSTPDSSGEASPESSPSPAATVSTPSWTSTFLEPAVLVAREISIEGPPGLLEHFAVNVDPDVHEYVVKTIEAGLRQEVTLKPSASGAVIRCQLDQLVMAAEQRVRVLERPGRVPVTVVAIGDAAWTTPAGAEKRGQTLRLVGEEPR